MDKSELQNKIKTSKSEVLGAIESEKTKLQQTLQTGKSEMSESIDSYITALQQNFTDSKKEILEWVVENSTPNITFRATGVSSYGDPGKCLLSKLQWVTFSN